MLVCHCKAVNDARIREEIQRGARDEFDVAAACGAGSACGGCVPAISRLLGECARCPVRGAVGRHAVVAFATAGSNQGAD